jgi:hypothetical protein
VTILTEPKCDYYCNKKGWKCCYHCDEKDCRQGVCTSKCWKLLGIDKPKIIDMRE